MTVTLTPEIEARFRTYAEDMDFDPDQLATDLLTSAFEEAEAELKETMEGLDRSAEGFAAGRWITGEELDRRLSAKIEAARARSNGSSNSVHNTERSAELMQA